MLLNIDEIKINDRIRKDYGNLEELAEDIKMNGLINPPVVTPDTYDLIAGERRLRAMQLLGYKQIEVRPMAVKDAEHQLNLEISENESRKDFSKAERIEYARRLERIESAKAKVRMSEGGKGVEIKTPLRTEDVVAKKLGIGGKDTYRKEKYIVDHQSDLSPDEFSDWDEGKLSTHKIYQKLKHENENYQMLIEMIPELEELVDTGIVTKTTALAIVNQLKPEEQEDFIKSMDITKKITQRQLDNYVSSRENQLNARVTELNEQIRQLNSTNSQLQNKLQYALKGQKEYEDLQAKIESLRQQKSEFLNRLNIVSEIGGLSADVQDMLEDKLAPIKFKQFIDVLHEEPVVKENLENIVHRVESWLDEMKKILGDSVVESVNIVEIMKGE